MNLALELLKSPDQINFASKHLAVLPELICCWSEVEGEDIEILSLMAKLVTLIPNLKIYCIFVLDRKSSLREITNHREASSAIYRFLSLSFQDFSKFWPLTKLLDTLDSNDHIIKYYGILSIAISVGMSDKELQQMLNIQLGCDEYMSATQWYLSDSESLQFGRSLIFTNKVDQFVDEKIGLKYTVNVSGVLLPHEKLFNDNYVEQRRDREFVQTHTAKKILGEIATGLSCSLPILLQGPAGVGKTSLIEEAGKLVGSSELLKIHLGDQTDGKLLLGTYITTSTPGKFKWQPGVLTTAVTEGRWILFEDIDMAPVDVIAVLLPLLETGWLHIPSRGERHRAKEGFHMFATRKFGKNSTNGKAVVGENLWIKLNVPEIEHADLKTILSTRFSNILEYLDQMLAVYKILDVNFPAVNGRQICVRDLMKWCERVSLLNIGQIDPAIRRELLFREAYDCFIAMIAAPELREALCVHLAEGLEISEHRKDYLLFHYVPEVECGEAFVKYGRAVLPTTAPMSRISDTDTAPFASTSVSLKNLERIGVSVKLVEPVLLVGETGTGKTTIVQKMASTLGQKLTVINMSQQSDSTDLLGGFKPVDIIMLASPIKNLFNRLFEKTFSVKQNSAFLDVIQKSFIKKKWDQLIIGFNNAYSMAQKLFSYQNSRTGGESPKKIRKILDQSILIEWENFNRTVQQFKAHVHQIRSNFLFSFVEGALVQAIKNGEWILLDEINLAAAETLEILSSLLQSSTGSILLLERGDTTAIKRHPDFRLFACMNPANDAGKRNLPDGLRSRFTEFWVDAPDSNLSDLLLIVSSYIGKYLPSGPSGDELCKDVADFYNNTKTLSRKNLLFDGADQRFHVSLRTLTRALSCSAYIAPVYGIRRSLFEGCFMTFLTGLGAASGKIVTEHLYRHILSGIRNAAAFVKQIPNALLQRNDLSDLSYVLIDCFRLEKGPLPIPDDSDMKFILTPSVEINLRNLARGCMSGKYPILIQGPTSAGKTSIIEYLAKKTGHRFIRINNHEHTDLQEYLGGYVSNDQGALVFQEGVLVEALRNGYWVVLDELNLAPSDVLEALNRLLDDNRELFLAEKQETIKPHPHFMLFATQNPAGQYGGRKQLSRAFRNRFLELHFTDIPDQELETIIEQRCLIAPSYAKKCVSVYKSLSKSRDASRIFDGRQSFITLRDLFRWALRRADSYERLAADGYMLIAERVRKESDRAVIQAVLEKELRVKLDLITLYDVQFKELQSKFTSHFDIPGVVWTWAMKKLFVLVYNAVVHFEPVLLIGETGCGKTTICQIIATILNQELLIVNAHQNSETSDFLGSQRPARKRDQYEMTFRLLLGKAANNTEFKSFDFTSTAFAEAEELFKRVRSLIKDNQMVSELDELLIKSKALFEWNDGPLVKAMVKGDLFLLDEISLADDSVLERLNSVLEPERQLTLVEKSGIQVSEIKAEEKFRFFATMNPGGDYGKKELSPALRNRFTEIWVPQVSNRNDLLMILSQKLGAFGPQRVFWAQKILDFINWFAEKIQKVPSEIVSLRDILSWANFMLYGEDLLGRSDSFVQGGNMVLIDGIGANPLFGNVHCSGELKLECQYQLSSHAGLNMVQRNVTIGLNDRGFGVEPFIIPFGPLNGTPPKFFIEAATTKQNCVRVLRAMQFKKPILLEGSPGAGKTSLITTIANLCRFPLVRINLSEQTDLMDLFGSDLPVEGGSGGEFGWRDGPFLKAMQEGSWVLLDELNLASQQVLEGLNACLDHRASVFIPELDKRFACHPSFRVFAAQNPQSQGGGRKGLPKSFVNRFTLVYVDELTHEDLLLICEALYPTIISDLREKMIEFNQKIKEETMIKCSFGWEGSPWEFNLRDLLRWLDLLEKQPNSTPGEFLDLIYVQRMRTKSDREHVISIYEDIFEVSYPRTPPQIEVTPTSIISSGMILERLNGRGTHRYGVPVESLQLLPSLYPTLHSILTSIKSNYPVLLVGPTTSGKSSTIRLLAALCGQKLEEFSLNPSIDALELLGGYEQVDIIRRNQEIKDLITDCIESLNRNLFCLKLIEHVKNITILWQSLLTNMEVKRGVFSDILRHMSNFSSYLPQYEDLSALVKKFDILVDSDARGQFEWMDSNLVAALENGHWILIDNVNLCSSSVLDRLNSVLETGGNLAINERGLLNGEIKVIVPHKNFRIFFAMDPRHGEISRAMRNRVVELCITNMDTSSIASKTSGIALSSSIGLPGDVTAENTFEKIEKGLLSIADLKMNAAKTFQGRLSSYFSSSSISPCPVIKGIDFARNSLLSNAHLDGLIMHFLLHEENYPWRSQFEYTVPVSRLALAACEIFVKRSSRNSLLTRKAFANFAIKNSKKTYQEMSQHLNSFLQIPSLDICHQRSAYLTEIGLSGIDPDLPFDLRVSGLSLPPSPSYIHLCTLLDLYYLKKMVVIFKSSLQSVIAGSMFELSKLVNSGDKKVNSLPHVCVKSLMPLICCVTDFLLAADHTQIILLSKLFTLVNQLFYSTNVPFLQLDKIVVLVHRMHKLLGNLKVNAIGLRVVDDIVQDLHRTLEIPKIRASSRIWKKRGDITLFRQELLDIHLEISLLDQKLNFWANSPRDWFLKKNESEKISDLMIDCVSTLYFLNSQHDMDISLLDSMKAVPQIIKEITSKYSTPEIRSLECLQESQESVTKFMIWPISDLECLSEAASILKDIFSLSKENEIEAVIARVTYFVQRNSSNSSFSPLLFEPFKRILWISDSDGYGVSKFNLDLRALKSSAADAYLHWHKSLWKNGYTFLKASIDDKGLNSLLEGDVASLLTGEIELEYPESTTCSIPAISGKSIIALSMLRPFDHVPLYSVPSKMRQLKHLTEFLSKSALSVAEDVESDNVLLAYHIEQFLGYFSVACSLNSLSQNELENVKLACETAMPPSILEKAVEVVELFAKSRFQSSSKARGLAWIKFGLLFLECYISDLALDPVEMRRAKLSFLSAEMEDVLAKQKVQAEFQILKTGSQLDFYQEKLSTMKSKESKWKWKLPFRPEKTQISELFSDLISLKNEVLKEKKIEGLLENLLVVGSRSEDEQALQQVLSIVSERLETKYPYYTDLVQPVVLAIHEIKYGLRTLQSLINDQHTRLNVNFLKQLLDFNADFNLKRFADFLDTLSLLHDSDAVCSILIVLMRKLTAFRRAQFADETELIIFSERVLSKISDLWDKLENDRLLKLEQENSIYKTHTHHIETQDEADEADFNKLFPDYADEFDNLDSFNGQNVLVFTPPKIDTFEVMSLFEEFNTGLTDFSASWSKAFSSSYTVASDIAITQKLNPDISLDLVGHTGYLFISKTRILHSDQDEKVDVYDFYNDSNICQANKACAVLYSFDSAVRKALKNWPEHSVLLQLSGICRRVLSFAATSPIMKFLTGLELLLVKSEDWEKYSSSEFSLKNEISKLVQLIVEWRKLELNSWRDLIQIETRKSIQKLSVQWFHLWKILMGIAAMNETPESSFLHETLELLNQFCIASTIGEFSSRLQILKTYSIYLSKLPNASVAHRLVHNVYSFFLQFADTVSMKLEAVKAPIMKDLKEYVRIASWKDVNIFAMKESAKRTHHHLNKLVKRYRLGLALNVREVIAGYHENIPSVPKGGSNIQGILDWLAASKSSFVSDAMIQGQDSPLNFPKRIGNAAQLFQKAQSFTLTTLKCDNVVQASSQLDGMAVDILERIAGFQSGEEISEKAQRGQKMIRKKAWVDLLKYLAMIGISPRSSQKYKDHQSVVFMNLQPVLNKEDLNHFENMHISVDLAHRAEIYHFRSIARLEIIRKLVVSHSPDVSSLEISKSISFLDHLMHFSLVRRSVIAKCAAQSSAVTSITTQMKDVLNFGLTSAYVDLPCRQYVVRYHTFITQIWIKLEQILLIADNEVKNALVSIHGQLSEAKSAVGKILCSISDEYFRSTSIANILASAFEVVGKLRLAISSLSSAANKLILEPLLLLLRSGVEVSDILMNRRDDENIITLAENCMEKALIVIQNFEKRLDLNEESNENLIANAQKEVLSPFISDSIEGLLKSLNVFMLTQSTLADSSIILILCGRLMPLIDQASRLIRFRILELLIFHKTCLKFSYILSNTFYSVIKNGFCLPNVDESGEDGGKEEDVNGVGIGEGDGKKDISDEIENEDQVEALQNQSEDAPDPQKKIDDEKNGIEMENDFDGKMEDVDDVEDSNSDGDEDQDMKEPEEQMGALDDSAEAVDEKLWDGDAPEGGPEEDEKTQNDDPVDAGGAESELAAQREDEGESSDKPEKQNVEDSAPEVEQDLKEEETSGNINEDEPDMYDEPTGLDVKPADDMQDNEDIDIPNDLDLGDDQNENDEIDDRQEHSTEVTEDSEVQEDKALEENLEMDEDSSPEEFPEVKSTQDDGNEKSEVDAEEDSGEEQIPLNGLDDAEAGAEHEEPAENNAEANSNQNESTFQQDSMPQGVEGQNGNQEAPSDSKLEAGAGKDDESLENDVATQGTESKAQDIPNENSLDKSQSISKDPNPHRSLGDARKNWIERLRNVTDSLENSDKQQESSAEAKGDEEFEFVKDDDEDQGNEQALGVADNEQLSQMNNQALDREEQDGEDSMDVDGESVMKNDQHLELPEHKVMSSISNVIESTTEAVEEMPDSGDAQDRKGAIENDEAEDQDEIMQTVKHFGNRQDMELVEPVDLAPDENVVDYNTLRQELEVRLSKWRLEGRKDFGKSQEIWKTFSNLTRDLSFQLCEHLRLILEPTLCSKLKGDYKTGKRLNMRKIIPYIASQFKKDKIWLKRTKPSKRTYQIMVAIDDSLSMSNSHSVQLAFESLVMITNALNQLEVGEIGVMSFGQEVKLLHAFESAWSDDAGSSVLSSFSFQQERTRVKLLMDQSLEVLQHSRAISQNPDLWQLEIIISDGICEDHEYIRTRVKCAAEDHIAMVFIILDTRPEKDSILQMSNVSYDIDPNTSVPVLKMSKYMDTFPFDFYVVVRDVERLPEVLSDTLRQFFQVFAA